jgi:mono/diheme cytochrome c family protein
MRRLMPSPRKIATLSLAVALAVGASACGKEEIKLSKADQQNANVEHGAELFHERCSGCHTLRAAAALGSKPTSQKANSERTNGPNFNVRKEQRDDVLLAIRNGGFSGAIMPANIVVGTDAEDVADFVSKYAGTNPSEDTTNNQQPNNAPAAP